MAPTRRIVRLFDLDYGPLFCSCSGKVSLNGFSRINGTEWIGQMDKKSEIDKDAGFGYQHGSATNLGGETCANAVYKDSGLKEAEAA